MVISKIKHLKNERETWLRTLDYMQQENVFLKTSLGDSIQNDINSEVLERVEFFQSQFVNKDAVIALLRYDIAEQNRLLESSGDLSNNYMAIVKKQNSLRKDMARMEKDFNELKFQFNTYLAEVL